jgi:hypothetical protein
MSQLGTLADRILAAVHRAPGCQLDELVLTIPELTWNQVFLEVDRLSRTGQVRMTAITQTSTVLYTPVHCSTPGTPSGIVVSSDLS